MFAADRLFGAKYKMNAEQNRLLSADSRENKSYDSIDIPKSCSDPQKAEIEKGNKMKGILLCVMSGILLMAS